VEVLIRENGGEPKWIDISKVFKVSGTRKPYSPSPPLLKDTKGFGQWYALYDKKTTKKQAIDYWFKNITKDDIPKIMEHTKQYIKDRDKVYRKDPIRYLRDRVFEDEIIKAEKKIDLDELYPFDTSGSSRKGRCSRCNSIVFGNKFTIHKDDSDCCKVKIKQYR
jgi:hypothetical protein